MKNIFSTLNFQLNMRFLFLIIIRLLITTNVPAQTVNVDAVIEKTSKTYEAWGGAFIKFTAQLRNEMNGATESFEGTVRMKKNKFVLTTPDMTVWFDGATQWTYMPRIEEVNIVTPSDEDLRVMNPVILLQDYKKDFNVACIGESTSVNARMAYDLVFTPKKKNDIEKIEIQIEKSTTLPAKLVVTMRNQVLITVINGMKAETLSDGIFTFPATSFPNAEIIDLR